MVATGLQPAVRSTASTLGRQRRGRGGGARGSRYRSSRSPDGRAGGAAGVAVGPTGVACAAGRRAGPRRGSDSGHARGHVADGDVVAVRVSQAGAHELHVRRPVAHGLECHGREEAATVRSGRGQGRWSHAAKADVARLETL